MDLWRLSSCTPSGRKGETVTVNASPLYASYYLVISFSVHGGYFAQETIVLSACSLLATCGLSARRRPFRSIHKSFLPIRHPWTSCCKPEHRDISNSSLNKNIYAASCGHFSALASSCVAHLNTSASDTGRLQRGQPTSMAYKYRASS